MRRIFKIFSFVLTAFYVGNIAAQVEGVSYALSFNASTSSYDCFLIIEKGEAFSKLHRIQFNSQISIVTPAGSTLEVSKSFMPYLGIDQNRKPLEWMITDMVSAPREDLFHDYYSISPNISQTSIYNNISEGDKLKLFSLKAISKENKESIIRFYENGKDININGTDFSNGFSLGSSNQIFKGIVMTENDDVGYYVQQEND